MYLKVNSSLRGVCIVDGPVLRALGWFLLSGKGKAEMDATQWEQDATEKQQKIAELEQEFSSAQDALQQQISSMKVSSSCFSRKQSVNHDGSTRLSTDSSAQDRLPMHAVSWVHCIVEHTQRCQRD